jgi:DNA-directed RNA polymerase
VETKCIADLKQSRLACQDVSSNDQEKAKRRSALQTTIDALAVLSRQVIKRPVMTMTYGVTMYGAREQILNELRDLTTCTNWTLPRHPYMRYCIFFVSYF